MADLYALTFWGAACLAVLSGGFILLICLALFAAAWTGALGAPSDTGERLIGGAIVVLSFLATCIPLTHIVQRLRHNSIPALVVGAGWLFALLALGLSGFAFYVDAGDFPWLGLPLLFFGTALTFLSLTRERSHPDALS